MAIGEKTNVEKAKESVTKSGYGPDIKFIYRDLATTPNTQDPNAEMPWALEEYLKNFLEEGWTIKHISFEAARRVGNMQELVRGVWIVLVQE